MYHLWKDKCEKQNVKEEKSCYYQYIFNNNFNINFHTQKRDRWDCCQEIKTKKQEKIPITPEELADHHKHLKHKADMRAEKTSDKVNNWGKFFLLKTKIECDIASAFLKILKNFVKDNVYVTDIVCWDTRNSVNCKISVKTSPLRWNILYLGILLSILVRCTYQSFTHLYHLLES